MSRVVDTTPQSSKDLGFAIVLLRNFISALEQPEDVRDHFVRLAKVSAQHELEAGRLAQ